MSEICGYGSIELETLEEFAERNEDKFTNFFDYATDIATPFNFSTTELSDMFLELYKYRYMIIDCKASSDYNSYYKSVDYNTYYKRAKVVYNLNKNKYIKLVASETVEYNPIENYSMTENSDETRTPNLTRTSEGTASESGTNSVSNITSNTSTDSNTSFDSTAFINNSKNELTGNSNTTGENTAKSNSTVTNRETGTEQTTNELTRKGNIGVTTTQQMLEQERAIADFSTIKIFFEDVAKLLFFDILNL